MSSIHIGNIFNSGSFADIYVGELRKGGYSQTVAVKMLKREWHGNQDQLHRFWDEYQILKKITSANTVQVLDFIVCNGHPCIIMDFIDGFTIKHLLEDSKFSFSPKMAFDIAYTVAQTLDTVYYHSKNTMGENLVIIHRDIKPANVMINKNAVIRVLDFGAARFEDADRLGKTLMTEPGTIKYSPPDRRLGNPGDHKGDIYALGWMLIEMLQNKLVKTPPSDKDDYNRKLQEILQTLPMGMPNTQWAQSVRDTLQRMCAYDPKHRLHAKQAMHMLHPYHQQASGLATKDLVTTYMQNTAFSGGVGNFTDKEYAMHSIQTIQDLYASAGKIAPAVQQIETKPEPVRITESVVMAGNTHPSAIMPESHTTNPSMATAEPTFSTEHPTEHPITQTSSWKDHAFVRTYILHPSPFFRNIYISALVTFVSLHLGMGSSMLLRGSSQEISTKRETTSTPPEQTPSIELRHLTISKEERYTMSIRSLDATEPLLELKPSQNTKELDIPIGSYEISFSRKNQENTTQPLAITEDMGNITLVCGIQDERAQCTQNP